jgi:hypothetical protein
MKIEDISTEFILEHIKHTCSICNTKINLRGLHFVCENGCFLLFDVIYYMENKHNKDGLVRIEINLNRNSIEYRHRSRVPSYSIVYNDDACFKLYSLKELDNYLFLTPEKFNKTAKLLNLLK